MAIKSILVLLSGGADDAAPVSAAFALAQRFAAHLEVLHVRPDPNAVAPFIGEGASGTMVQEMIDAASRDAAARERKAVALFEDARAKAPQANAEWRVETGREADAAVRRGRLVDLIVAPRPAEEVEGQVTVEALLFDSGRPVLLMPPAPPSGIGSRIVIGWNGSGPAARAVAEARPFLAEADHVQVIAVRNSGAGDVDADELVQALAWRGVSAKGAMIESGDGVGTALRRACESGSADLLVMGAYGHSRLRELVLGGATLEIIRRGDVPVLMAH